MTADPAAARDHLQCAWTRRDLAATGGMLRCSSCAAALVEHQADVPQKSSIVNRTVFRSASLRRAAEAKPS